MRIVRIAATIAAFYLLCLTTLAVWSQFSPGRAVVLVLLAVLVWIRPAAGAAVLFFAFAADATRSLFGNLFVSYSEIAFAICLVFWLARLSVDGRLRSIDWRVLYWGTPFIGAVFLSATLNNDWYRVLPHVLRSSELVCACWFANNAWQTERSRSAYRWAIGGAAVFYSLIGLSQVLTAFNARVYSLLGNPNQFGAYLDLLFPFLLVFYFSGAHRKLWLAIIALTVLAGLAAQSRAALLGATLATLLLVFHQRGELIASFARRPVVSVRAFLSRRWDTIVLLFFYAALSVFFLDAMAPRIATRALLWFHAYQERASQGVVRNVMDQRAPFYRIGVAIWKENPIVGIGPGNYENAIVRHWALVADYSDKIPFFPAFQTGIRLHLHNLPLQLAVEYGLVGLAAFLYFFARIALVFWRRRDSIWCLAGLGIMIAFVVFNLVDVTAFSLALETGFALGAALPGAPPRAAICPARWASGSQPAPTDTD